MCERRIVSGRARPSAALDVFYYSARRARGSAAGSARAPASCNICYIHKAQSRGRLIEIQCANKWPARES